MGKEETVDFTLLRGLVVMPVEEVAAGRGLLAGIMDMTMVTLPRMVKMEMIAIGAREEKASMWLTPLGLISRFSTRAESEAMRFN